MKEQIHDNQNQSRFIIAYHHEITIQKEMTPFASTRVSDVRCVKVQGVVAIPIASGEVKFKRELLKKSNELVEILLMEEILHHLGCIKPCK